MSKTHQRAYLAMHYQGQGPNLLTHWSQLQRFRWLTSLVFSSSIALEYLTPLMPRHFLLLASLSNIGKSVGVTTYVATHPAFQRSFARGENLADINAKGQVGSMIHPATQPL